jgi:hypothetical protein
MSSRYFTLREALLPVSLGQGAAARGGRGVIAANAQGTGAAEGLSAAHRALKGDPSIQFTLKPAPPPPEAPTWLRDVFRWLEEVLKPVARLVDWLAGFLPDAPYVRILLWAVLAAAAAGFIWMIYRRIADGEWRMPRRRRKVAGPAPADEEWAPESAPARSWLEEADALAAQGRFADAVHHLLLRSVEDIARRRPKAVRPALTSRELARVEGVPAPARTLFAHIAALVERSLFGGRGVERGDWEGARAAYADFVLPRTWRP